MLVTQCLVNVKITSKTIVGKCITEAIKCITKLLKNLTVNLQQQQH